ncbi:MAG: dTDP-4-dehydrorhamnose 3,5-epimerase [Clostridiales bacterium]
MSKFKFIETGIEDLFIIEPSVFGDKRGFFLETYNFEDFKEAGLNMNFVQDNFSYSSKGVLRGMHFQHKYPQGKLVRAVQGEIYDVGVDLRKNSKTFGKWFGVILSEENKRMFYVPEGFAHGFLVISEFASFAYKCTNYYHPEDEVGFIWNDSKINIDWHLEKEEIPTLSKKDEILLRFSEIEDKLF